MRLAAPRAHFGHGGGSPYSHALLGGGALTMRESTSVGPVGDLPALAVMDVDRYVADADEVDRAVLARTAGAVLDLGCGPGRMVRAAVLAGRRALGIDVSATAVDIAQADGLPVLERDLSGALPCEGSWDTVLLLDGNIGIGGDPTELLDRCRSLMSAGGRVLLETDPDPAVDRRLLAEVVDRLGRASDPFPWAQIGVNALIGCAAEVGLRVEWTWTAGRSGTAARTFVALSG